MAALGVGQVLDTISGRLLALEDCVRSLVKQSAGARLEDFENIEEKLADLPFKPSENL